MAHGLVAAWLMSERSGKSVMELVSGNTSTYSGNALGWDRGDGGVGIKLDGSAQKLDSARVISPFAFPLTIFAYFDPNSAAPADDGLIHINHSTGNIYAGICLYVTTTSRLAMIYGSNDGNTVANYRRLISPNNSVTGSTRSGACVVRFHSSTAAGATLYIDGKSQAVVTSDGTGKNMANGAAPPSIGYYHMNTVLYSISTIYAILVYNRALADSEILSLHTDPYQAFRIKRDWASQIFSPSVPGAINYRRRIIVTS